MSDFKVGPAMTRDGRAAFIVSINEGWMARKQYPMDVVIEVEPGEWIADARWEGGHQGSNKTIDPGDILPNNEPEWRYVSVILDERVGDAGAEYWAEERPAPAPHTDVILRVDLDGNWEIAWQRGQSDAD